MTPTPQRLTPCDANSRKARLDAARGFWSDAVDLDTLGTGHNATLVTLYVHAGIAASDVICCARLGHYSASGNHADAIALLAQAAPDLKAPLQRLLGMKTAAGYGAAPVSAKKVGEARAAAEKLITTAQTM